MREIKSTAGTTSRLGFPPEGKSRVWLKAASDLVRLKSRLRPRLAIVLGTGFQHALSRFTVTEEISYGELPGFPSVGVTGHAGKLVIGQFGTVPVLALKGRAHFYEGHEMERVTFSIRFLAEMGVRVVLLTNAAGGINRKYRPGDFMILKDHINLMGTNPLRGAAGSDLPAFVDLTEVYDHGLRELLHRAARQSKVRVHSGTYLAVSGPSYETPAEITAFARLGADAVGMSTVPEAIVARQCGLKVVAISCITNPAAGLGKGHLSHGEVLAAGESKKENVAQLLYNFVQLYGRS